VNRCRMSMSSNAADAEVFVYTGDGGDAVPDDVVRVRVDPSITSIPACAFRERNKLAEVELCEGLVEIGVESFARCDHSITKINTPHSLRRINVVHSIILFELRFVSTLALKA